ncbi:MAG TPA: LysM peptidoglycan-binding domain-containing protein [Thermaerobacter sp.]
MPEGDPTRPHLDGPGAGAPTQGGEPPQADGDPTADASRGADPPQDAVPPTPAAEPSVPVGTEPKGVPEAAAAGAAAATAGAAPAIPPPCPGGQTVRVQPGDTLFLLAQRYGVPLAAVILANPQLGDPDRLVPGEWICIPSAPPGCPGGHLVVVRPDDTLFAIAQRFRVPLEAVIAANPQLADPDRIEPGQIVCVPRSPGRCQGVPYVVQPGDTLLAIAQRFGVDLQALIAANSQITNPDRIWPGEVVCVPKAPDA